MNKITCAFFRIKFILCFWFNRFIRACVWFSIYVQFIADCTGVDTLSSQELRYDSLLIKTSFNNSMNYKVLEWTVIVKSLFFRFRKCKLIPGTLLFFILDIQYSMCAPIYRPVYQWRRYIHFFWGGDEGTTEACYQDKQQCYHDIHSSGWAP